METISPYARQRKNTVAAELGGRGGNFPSNNSSGGGGEWRGMEGHGGAWMGHGSRNSTNICDRLQEAPSFLSHNSQTLQLECF